MPGMVYLVGAGPGDPGLITVRGLECLARAEVVVADRLVSAALLERVPAGCELVVRGSRRELNQEAIHRLLVERASAGKVVVRLKGGDPFIFGRGGEEAEVLAAAHIPFMVVPGVTAALGMSACAGIPLTQRGVAAGVVLATGHEMEEGDTLELDWHTLADSALTAVLYMSVGRIESTLGRLMAAGRDPATPAAVVVHGSLPTQRVVRGTIRDLATRAREAGVQPPALVVVAEVVRRSQAIAWFEQRPLAGKRLLVLAEREEIRTLDELGLSVEWVAPFEFELQPDALVPAVREIGRYGAVAFTSRRSVQAFAQALDRAGLDGRALAGCKIACLAGGTGEALFRELRLRAELTASDGGRALGQAILDAGIRTRVLFPRAAGGRKELPDLLAAAGVPVDRIDCYLSRPRQEALASIAKTQRDRPFDAIAFASPRGVAELFAQLDGGLGSALVGAIGKTTEQALRERSVSSVIVPEQPSVPRLVEQLVEALRSR